MNKKLFSLWMLLTISILGIVAKAQYERHEVAYLYNFTNFIEWPQHEQAVKFVIGVLGKNESITAELEKLAQIKKIQGKPVQVVEFSNINEITTCQILFVPERFSSEIPRLMTRYEGRNLLIVSESPNGISRGAAISFLIRNDKLNFRLSEENVAYYGLKVSSRLTELAVK